jgi:tight adherence protein C
MDTGVTLEAITFFWSPISFALLVGLATALVWMGFRPAPAQRAVRDRLNGYLAHQDPVDAEDMRRPFVVRVVWPPIRQILHLLGGLAPSRNLEATRLLLLRAGEPGALTPLDFFGLRLLLALGGFAGYLLLAGKNLPLTTALRNALLVGGVGFLGPLLWVRSRARRRAHEIERALPDALDMLTIGVEAGLAFESALLRVGEQWDNALTREFRRSVAEMRVGTARDVTLWRMVERAGVPDLGTFVAVLVQSSQLGVSITQVLHAQADQIRLKRRQRAEELARKASVKMVFALAFLLLPALFIVVLGPSIPRFAWLFSQTTSLPTVP